MKLKIKMEKIWDYWLMRQVKLKVFKFGFPASKRLMLTSRSANANFTSAQPYSSWIKFRQDVVLVGLQPVVQRLFQLLVVVEPPPGLPFRLLDYSVFGVWVPAFFRDYLLSSPNSRIQSNLELFFSSLMLRSSRWLCDSRRRHWRGCYGRGRWSVRFSWRLAWPTCFGLRFIWFSRQHSLRNIAIHRRNSGIIISLRLSVPDLYIPSVIFLKLLGVLCVYLFRCLVLRKWSSLGILPQLRITLRLCSKFSYVNIAHFHLRYTWHFHWVVVGGVRNTVLPGANVSQGPLKSHYIRLETSLANFKSRDRSVCGIGLSISENECWNWLVFVPIISSTRIHLSLCHSFLDDNFAPFSSYPTVVVQVIFHWDCVSV